MDERRTERRAEGFPGRVMSAGVIEVDLFSEDVDSLSHPEVVKFKRLLEQVAREYHCKLTSFEVSHGTVSFSFDDDALLAEILKVLREREE
jgi:hypothetical protein